MQIKSLVLVALSAGVALARPRHTRDNWRGTAGSTTVGGASETPRVMAVAASSTSITVNAVAASTPVSVSTSTKTVTSYNYVTVTATSSSASTLATGTVVLATSSSVNAGAFYNAGTKSRGTSSAAATTLATVTSASRAASSAAGTSAAAVSSAAVAVSGSKKGISYNSASLVSPFGVKWAYNWASSSQGLASGVEFVPMCWGLNSLSTWASDAASAISAGAKAVLSFNEPDLSSQSNIDAVTAAAKHISAMSPLVGKVEIGSPAITNGGGTMGTAWLDSFFTACGSNCPVDFVAFHWYDSASNFAYFQQHVSDVLAVASKHGVTKLWLTEFGASGTDAAQASFLQQAIPFLESNSAIERYAYFMASDGTLLTNNALNTIGKAYVSA